MDSDGLQKRINQNIKPLKAQINLFGIPNDHFGKKVPCKNLFG